MTSYNNFSGTNVVPWSFILTLYVDISFSHNFHFISTSIKMKSKQEKHKKKKRSYWCVPIKVQTIRPRHKLTNYSNYYSNRSAKFVIQNNWLVIPDCTVDLRWPGGQAVHVLSPRTWLGRSWCSWKSTVIMNILVQFPRVNSWNFSMCAVFFYYFYCHSWSVLYQCVDHTLC